MAGDKDTIDFDRTGAAPAPATPEPVANDALARPAGTDRYTLDSLLGRGGMGEVWRAHDAELDRSVALKILHSSRGPHDWASFLSEARATAGLQHPGIVPVYDLGRLPDGRVFYTMQEVVGRTLRVAIAESHAADAPPILRRRLLEAFHRVCVAVGFAHRSGWLHRDLKPGNVMLGGFGEVYVVDWGIAQVAGVAEDAIAGTPGWIAPEQARGEVCDARTDVWGVGGLLYYCLCGRRPNRDLTLDERALTGADARPVVPPTGIVGRPPPPPELVRIAMKALSFDPADRYPNSGALANDLNLARAEGWWFERRTYRAGAVIVSQGQEADSAYLIVDGQVEVSRNGGPIAELGPGETFGEAALVNGGARTATVTAETDVVVRVLTRAALDAEVRRGGWMGAMVRHLAARFHEVSLEAVDARR